MRTVKKQNEAFFILLSFFRGCSDTYYEALCFAGYTPLAKWIAAPLLAARNDGGFMDCRAT